MENPHEQLQNSLLSRIINNLERLNESVEVMNQQLKETNSANKQISLVANIWENYSENCEFNLQATNNKKMPL